MLVLLYIEEPIHIFLHSLISKNNYSDLYFIGVNDIIVSIFVHFHKPCCEQWKLNYVNKMQVSIQRMAYFLCLHFSDY